MTYRPNARSSSVQSMATIYVLMSTSCATSSSAHNSPVLHTCLPQGMPCASTCCEQTTRLLFGDVRWRECRVPSPHTQGWLVESGAITINWTDQRPAPDELLEMTHCGCRTGWKTARCSCKKGLMQSTDACACKGCTNRRQAEEESESESDSLQDNGEDSEDSDDL